MERMRELGGRKRGEGEEREEDEDWEERKEERNKLGNIH